MGWMPVALTSSKQEENSTGPFLREENIGGFRYYRTGVVHHVPLPFITEYRLMSALGERLREIVKEEKPRLLHAHSPILTILPTLWIGHKLQIPVVYEIRAFWEDAAVDHRTYKHNSWQYKFVRSIETWVCRKVDHVVVLCQGIKDDLIKRGIPPGKMTIVPNGVNVEDFLACDPDEEFLQQWRLIGKKVIGFVGSFYRYEGLDLLVKAVARLATTRSDIALLLVGGGEMEDELRKQIHQLHLEETVIMAGRISPHRIPGVYSLIDILVYPRYSMRLTELVTPLKPLEAMAMGKALIASDIGGHRELIKHGQTGILFPPGDVEALVRLLEQLLDNPEHHQVLGQQAVTWVRQERSWDQTAAVYADVYARALESVSHLTHGKLSRYYSC
jgi:PEP-CTERM/exosortase A-associated glycosyltransferase